MNSTEDRPAGVEKATESVRACVEIANILNIYCERVWLAKVVDK